MLHFTNILCTLLEYLSGGNHAGSLILPTSTTRWKHLSRNTPPDRERAQWSLKERTWSHRSSDSYLVKLHFTLYLSITHTFPLFCSESFILLVFRNIFFIHLLRIWSRMAAISWLICDKITAIDCPSSSALWIWDLWSRIT